MRARVPGQRRRRRRRRRCLGCRMESWPRHALLVWAWRLGKATPDRRLCRASGQRDGTAWGRGLRGLALVHVRLCLLERARCCHRTGLGKWRTVLRVLALRRGRRGCRVCRRGPMQIRMAGGLGRDGGSLGDVCALLGVCCTWWRPWNRDGGRRWRIALAVVGVSRRVLVSLHWARGVLLGRKGIAAGVAQRGGGSLPVGRGHGRRPDAGRP